MCIRDRTTTKQLIKLILNRINTVVHYYRKIIPISAFKFHSSSSLLGLPDVYKRQSYYWTVFSYAGLGNLALFLFDLFERGEFFLNWTETSFPQNFAWTPKTCCMGNIPPILWYSIYRTPCLRFILEAIHSATLWFVCVRLVKHSKLLNKLIVYCDTITLNVFSDVW